VRKVVVGVVVAALAASAATVAFATGHKMVYKGTLFPNKAGKPTSVVFDNLTTVTGPEWNIAVWRKHKWIFPKGFKYNNKVIPPCTASAAKIKNDPKGACPVSTRMGSGVAFGWDAATGDLGVDVGFYNSKTGFIFIAEPRGVIYPISFFPVWDQANHTLNTPIRGCAPGDLEDTVDCDAGEARIKTIVAFMGVEPKVKGAWKSLVTGTKVNNIKVHYNKAKPIVRKGKALMTAPKTCPAGGWDFPLELHVEHYDVGYEKQSESDETFPHKTPCKK